MATEHSVFLCHESLVAPRFFARLQKGFREWNGAVCWAEERVTWEPVKERTMTPALHAVNARVEAPPRPYLEVARGLGIARSRTAF